MFSPFRGLIEVIDHLISCIRVSLIPAIEAVARSINRVADAQEDAGPAAARLEAIEKRQALWEVEIEALVAMAKGKLEAASNAEARTRTMKRHYEKNFDPLDIPSEEVETTVGPGDAPGGEVEEVQPLRVDVAPNNKANALMRKWGAIHV